MNQRFPLHSTPLFPIALQIKTQFFFFFLVQITLKIDPT